jgi:glycerol-3-phosphate dehydrogenase
VRMEQGAVSGAELECQLTGRVVRIAARCIVNATGPWSDSVRQFVDPSAAGSVRGTKGAHISVPRDRVGNEAAVAITHPRDGRVMFLLPAGKFTIVGTTDTDFSGAVDDVCASAADVEYLLEAANYYAPAAQLARGDVVAAWAGIRPLVASTASTTAAVSREHAIAMTVPGMLTVTGGKLTTHRLMGAQIIDLAEKFLGRSRAPALTDRALLVEDRDDDDREPLLSPMSRWRWSHIRRAIREEMALTIADVLIRRTTLAFELRDNGRALAPAVAAMMRKELGWDAARETAELVRYGREAARMFRVE